MPVATCPLCEVVIIADCMCARCSHICNTRAHSWSQHTRDQRLLVLIVPQAPSSLQGPRNETAHSVLNQSLASQDQQLKSILQENWLCQLHCSGSTRFVIEMVENSDSTVVHEICTLLLSEMAWLTSSLRLHVYSNCTCASSVCKKVVRPKPDQPDRLLQLWLVP